MENSEQQLIEASVSARAGVLTTSEPIESKTPFRFDISGGYSQPTASMSTVAPWKLEDFLSQLHYIRTIELGTLSSRTGDVVFEYRNTLATFLNTFTTFPSANFKFFSWELQFFCEVMCSPQVAGQYLMVYDCMPARLARARLGNNPVSITGNVSVNYNSKLPREPIMMGRNSITSMPMPWNCQFSKLSVADTNLVAESENMAYDMGTLRVVCINRIQKIETVSNPSMRFWAKVTKFNYSGYAPKGQFIS